jgi:hypothetical protein
MRLKRYIVLRPEDASATGARVASTAESELKSARLPRLNTKTIFGTHALGKIFKDKETFLIFA